MSQLINYSEWMAEVNRLKASDTERYGLTAGEIAAQYGRTKKWALANVITPLVKEGKMTVHRFKSNRPSDGVKFWMTEYVLTKGKREA